MNEIQFWLPLAVVDDHERNRKRWKDEIYVLSFSKFFYKTRYFLMLV